MTDQAERVAAALLSDTDLLTGNSAGTPDLYTIHADDVPALVTRILALAARHAATDQPGKYH